MAFKIFKFPFQHILITKLPKRHKATLNKSAENYYSPYIRSWFQHIDWQNIEKGTKRQREAPLVHSVETSSDMIVYVLHFGWFIEVELNLAAAIIFHPASRMTTFCEFALYTCHFYRFIQTDQPQRKIKKAASIRKDNMTVKMKVKILYVKVKTLYKWVSHVKQNYPYPEYYLTLRIYHIKSLFILQFVYCLKCRDFRVTKTEASYANTTLY